jgi:hypothetical protein
MSGPLAGVARARGIGLLAAMFRLQPITTLVTQIVDLLKPTVLGERPNGHGGMEMRQTGNAVSEKSVAEKMRCQPRVWDCHAGEKYPVDAVYMGCRVRDRKGGVSFPKAA